MKILVVSSHEQQFGGGEGRMSFEFAVELSKRHKVTLVFPGTDAGTLPGGASLAVYPIRSIDYTLPAMSGGEIHALFRFLDSYRPDVIHSHTPWFLGAMVQLWKEGSNRSEPRSMKPLPTTTARSCRKDWRSWSAALQSSMSVQQPRLK